MITFKAFSFLLKHKQQAYHNFQFSTFNSQLPTLNPQLSTWLTQYLHF